MGTIETTEQRVPCLSVVFPSSQILEKPGSHAVDYFLVGVGVIPPVARHAVPTGGVRVARPCHSARVNPLSGADRMVGPLAGLEGFNRSDLTSLLRHRLPWQYQRNMNEAGSLSCGERPQKAPSMHETVPFRFLVGNPGWPERRAAWPHRSPSALRRRAACIVPVRRAARIPAEKTPGAASAYSTESSGKLSRRNGFAGGKTRAMR